MSGYDTNLICGSEISGPTWRNFRSINYVHNNDEESCMRPYIHTYMRHASIQEIRSAACSRLVLSSTQVSKLFHSTWKYYSVETSQSSNVCKAVVLRGGTSFTTYNNTNLTKHLKEQEDFLASGEKEEKNLLWSYSKSKVNFQQTA